MTNLLVITAAVLMIIAGVGLIALDLFTRAFYSVYSRMFLGKRSGYNYGAVALVLIVAYVLSKSDGFRH
jgi:hypothetical protein